LLQILLVGQPELDEKLDSMELRQLKQRIALRSQLLPLDLEETRGYIQRRLHIAGAPSATVLFPTDTVETIHRHSRGIPRVINTVCENALIGAYARQLGTVPPDIIDEVAADLRLNVAPPPRMQKITNFDDNPEVWQAVKTMLQFQSRRQEMRSREAESLLTTAPGASKHEPII
jgi:general secretion pathway protein A